MNSTSIIIPAYGPCFNLPSLLRALGEQSLRPKEIIVVHSGPVRLAAEEVCTQNGTILIRVEERLYAGAARNLGATYAKGSILAFLDADVIPAKNWHETMLNEHNKRPTDVIAGAVGYQCPGGYWGMSLWLAEFSSVFEGNSSRYVESEGASCNMLIARDMLDRAGGFPADFLTCEDTYLIGKLRAFGHRTFFCNAARVYHCNIPGLGNAMRHSYRLGKWSSVSARTVFFQHRSYPAKSLSISSLWIQRSIRALQRLLRWRRDRFFYLAHFPGVLLVLMSFNAGFVIGLRSRLPISVSAPTH